MPDIIIYPNGKPVRVKWFDQDPPTEDDIDEMYDTYAKSQQPVNTGRIGPDVKRITGNLPPSPDRGGFVPVIPGTTPGVPNPAPSSGDPNQRHEVQPPISNQATNPLDFAVGIAQKYNQPQPYSGPKATPQNNIILGGLQQQANAAQKAKQLQQGPSVHDVKRQIEQNQVKNAYNKQKAAQDWAIAHGFKSEEQQAREASQKAFQDAQDARYGTLEQMNPAKTENLAPQPNVAPPNIDPFGQTNQELIKGIPNQFLDEATKLRAETKNLNEKVVNSASFLGSFANPALAIFPSGRHFAGNLVGEFATLPLQIAKNVQDSLSPSLTGQERILAGSQAVTDLVTFGIEPEVARSIGSAFKEMGVKAFPVLEGLFSGTPERFMAALDEIPTKAATKSAFVEQLEKAGHDFKGFTPEGKLSTTVKAKGNLIPEESIKIGEINAIENQETRKLHENVREQSAGGQAEVSTAQNSQGVQQETFPRIQTSEAKQTQEVKPAESVTQFRHEDTAQIRQKLGLPEYQGGGTNWDDAIKKAFSEGHVERADSLVEDINNGNRHVFKPEERAGVAIKGQALSDHLDALGQQMDAAKAAGDQAGYDALRGEYNDTKGRINDYLDALDKSGSGAGDALQSSKIKFGQQTDPVRIERDFEAAAGRKPNEQESADLEKLRQEVIRAQKAQADAEAGRQVAEQARAEAEARANFAEEQRQARQATRRTKSETIDAQIDELGKKWREKITQTSANAFLDPEAYKIIAQTANLYIKKGLIKFEDVVDAVKTHLDGVTDRHIIDALSGNYPREAKTNRELLTERQALQRQLAENKGNLKIQAKIYDIEHQIRTGEIKAKTTRVTNPASVERQQLQADLGKANQKLRYYIESKKKIGPVELLSRVQRFSILSGPSVFGKLGVATASHSLITPIEDLIGVGVGKLSGLKGVEASASLRGDVAAVKEFFKKETWRDVWSKATGKGNTLGNAYGTEKFKGGPVWEFFGNLHGAVKTPLQRATFQKEAIKMTDFLASKGIDVTKPEVITSITAHAYQKSLEAILMNDSKAVQQARKIINDIPFKMGSTIAPIVRVPINFAGRTGEYIAGLPYGAGKQILAKISKTPLDEAAQNAILRAYKRGSVGAALGIVGFYHPDLTDDLPSWAKHTPVVETLALGGALRKGWDQANHTKKGTTADAYTHLGSAAYQAGNEYAQNIPGVETVAKVLGGVGGSDTQAEGRLGKAAADYITSFVSPQLFQQIGKQFDPEAVKSGENYYKTQGFREEFAKNIPGLRQTLADVPVPKDDWWAKSNSKEFKETQGLDLKFSAPDWIKDKTKSNYDATSQQYNQRYRTISTAIQKAVRETLADSGYNRMGPEDKARVLKRIVESARKEANAQVNASRH